MAAGRLGQIRTPDDGHRIVPGARWVADNGCFRTWKSGEPFDEARWQRWLDAQPRTADWAVVPDVVCDHPATLALWARLAPVVRGMGFTPAFVVQNGCAPSAVPADAGAVFIGGDDGWKESDRARLCVEEANRRGIPAHMGRVNSERRFRLAASWGCDSADGTFLVFGPDVLLPRLLGWVRRAEGGVPFQPSLFDVR